MNAPDQEESRVRVAQIVYRNGAIADFSTMRRKARLRLPGWIGVPIDEASTSPWSR